MRDLRSHSSDESIRSSGRIGRYLWVLSQFSQEGRHLATSKDIGEGAGINATQVRRDLSTLLGRSGKRGVGYNVQGTLEALRSQTTISVYGDGPATESFCVGDPVLKMLGIAFTADGEFPTVAVLDYQSADRGREVAQQLVNAGVSLIINYAPYLIEVRPGRVVHVSPLLALAEAVA